MGGVVGGWGFWDRVISYLGETGWSAVRSAGPQGFWDASEEKPQRTSPEPVSFIRSDKLFLSIAMFLLFYNAVIWNSDPLSTNPVVVINVRTDPLLNVYTDFFSNMYTSTTHKGGDICIQFMKQLVTVMKYNTSKAEVEITQFRVSITITTASTGWLEDVCVVNE